VGIFSAPHCLLNKEILCSLFCFNRVVPIIYQVHRARDGSSFATRKVEAKQKGQVVFTLNASFQVIILVMQTFNIYNGILIEQINHLYNMLPNDCHFLILHMF
jgi:hypothetical protein